MGKMIMFSFLAFPYPSLHHCLPMQKGLISQLLPLCPPTPPKPFGSPKVECKDGLLVLVNEQKDL